MDLIWEIYGIPPPEIEYKFCPTRKWRFDYAWPLPSKVAVEIEGAVWTHGRHTRGAGFVADMSKYNEAGKLGWRVFRFTPQQLRKGEAQEFMKAVLKATNN